MNVYVVTDNEDRLMEVFSELSHAKMWYEDTYTLDEDSGDHTGLYYRIYYFVV